MKYRKKKCTESQQINSSMQDDPTEKWQNKQVKENNVKRKRAMAKEHSRRFREKKGQCLKICSSCGFIVFTSAV